MDSPTSPEKRGNGKSAEGKSRKIKEKKEVGGEAVKSRSSFDDETEDAEKCKKRKSNEGRTRPSSPQTVVEVGPLAESEQILQKVKTLVKKKKTVIVFHCRIGKMFKDYNKRNPSQLFICRKSVNCIPPFQTYSEACAEFPKYISIGIFDSQDFNRSFKGHIKILIGLVGTALPEPDLSCIEFPNNLVNKCKKYYSIKDHVLPYDAFFMTSLHFYQSYQRTYRKLLIECGNPDKNSLEYMNRICVSEIQPQSYTLKTVMCSPLHDMVDVQVNAFYNVRLKKSVKETYAIGLVEKPMLCPVKNNFLNSLGELIKKHNWCSNHIESEVDIEITPWPGIDELINSIQEGHMAEKGIVDKMEKRLDLLGRYIKNLLNKCRSKEPKGAGPMAEYLYWIKREDSIGPLLLTLYGKGVSNILYVLKSQGSSEAEDFIEKRLSLKRYYETSRDNRDYISVSIHCLEGINHANDLEEVQKIIPVFWANLRYLWLLSGYWAVKNNITGFIERVQYLIVKKSIKVLEVNHFFLLPQTIAKHLAVDVINTMEKWKSSFYEEKARIEKNKWEMRWEFPVHKIFSTTDYVAKLAHDFCYLSDSLKMYLDIFCYEFAKVVHNENIIETFSQRVQSLTTPLRNADFNIYDPDNDVHWNLLIETFTRELSSIVKESFKIINESFMNLRSSLHATNLLLKFKKIESEEKSLKLLLKKFEYVNIQIIKEIKLINELITNQKLVTPILPCHCRYSGAIYWLRQLTTSFQYRFVYLESINEINETKTQKSAKVCFENFMKFYEFFQLSLYLDWIKSERGTIKEQLSRRIFKLRSTSSILLNGLYKSISMQPSRVKIMVNDRVSRFHVKISTKKLLKNKMKYIEHKNEKHVSEVIQNSCDKNNLRKNSKDINVHPKSEGLSSAIEKIDHDTSGLKRLLLYLLHEEKRLLQDVDLFSNINLFLPSKKVFPLECEQNNVYSQNEIGLKEEFIEEIWSSPTFESTFTCRASRGETNVKILNNSNEMIFSIVSSQLCKKNNITTLMEEILNISRSIIDYSFENKGFEDLCPGPLGTFNQKALFITDIPSLIDFPVIEFDVSVISEKDNTLIKNFNEYPILDKGSLFKASSTHQKTVKDVSALENWSLGDTQSIYDMLLKNPTGVKSYAFYEFISVLDKHTSSYVKDSSNKFKEILKNKTGTSNHEKVTGCSCRINETAGSVLKEADIPQNEYLSRSLLNEKGLTIDVNFDVKLFSIIMELNQFIKLGYQLPEEFYGLALLKKALRNDMITLRKTVDNYNNFLTDISKESVLLYKKILLAFEYLLLKGVNYYSWHTAQVKKFYIVLYRKMEYMIALNHEAQSVIRFMGDALRNIKTIDMFDFSEVGIDRFKGIEDFFVEIEQRRNFGFEKLFDWFSSLASLLNKLEYLVFDEFTGRNNFMVLFYKYYEESILDAVVSNFLHNMKKFRNFLIGATPKRLYVKLINTSRINYNFNIDQCDFYFKRSIEDLLKRYQFLGRWILGSCKAAPWVKSGGMNKIYKHNFLEDLIRLKVISKELIDMQNLICSIRQDLSSFLSRWQHYNILWNFDKEISTENIFQHTQNIIKKCDSIFCYYDRFINELNSCKEYADIYCIRVDLTVARTEILNNAVQWKNILKCKLTELSQSHSSKLHSLTSEIHEIFLKKVCTLDDFENVLQYTKDFEDFNCDYSSSLSFITELQYILARHGLRYSEEERAILLKIQSMYSEAHMLVKYRTFLIKPSMQIFKNKSRELINSFGKECELFAGNYYKEGPGTVGENLQIGFSLQQKYKADFERLNIRRKNIMRAEVLFQHVPISYEFFDEAYDEFKLLELVFELYRRYKEAQAQWAQIPWIHLNSNDLTKGIADFLSEFEDFNDGIKGLPVAQQVKKCMLNFENSIPIMMDLKNESLKKRHWKELMEKTDYHFEMLASKFTLNDLFSMKLHLHRETVGDIIGKATRELNIEKYVSNMMQFWRSQQLRCTAFQGLQVLENNMTLLDLLDDYGIDLQRVAASQFALPFLSEIKDWERRLTLVREVVSEWSHLQEDILSLRTIFEDRCLQKAFPASYELYNKINKDFLKLINIIQYKSSILDQAMSSALLPEIKMSQRCVMDCYEFLKQHLTHHRALYPRFYLIMDHELTRILGSIPPENVQITITKVLNNISSLLIKEINQPEGTCKIEGLMSAETECLTFKTAIIIEKDVSECMKSLQKQMKYSIKYITKMCIYNYATLKEPRLKWIEDNLNTSVLASIHVWWTAEVEHIFSKIKKGDLQAMKTYSNVLKRLLHDLFQKVNENLPKLKRMKFINVIMVDLHGQDIVDKFANNSVMSASDFEWKSQIKFYWKKSADTLIIQQCFGEFEYGYEYSGVGTSLVMTPLTDRVYLSLTYALSNNFPAAMTGPSGSGKTEMVKSLAMIFGEYCAFRNCSESFTLESFKNTLHALCEDGIWSCFDEFHNIEASTLSMIGKELDNVRRAVKNKQTHFFMDGKELCLVGKFGFFITMNPGIPHNSLQVPQNVRLLFRPVSCINPQIEQICFAILFSEGFTHAQVLSKKIAKLYEFAQNQLSSSSHYDFGLRTLKPLLIVAGDLKRSAPDMEETVVLMRAIRDFNRSKLIPNDENIFTELRRDLFPDVDCPPITYPELEKAVKCAWSQRDYIYNKNLADKVVQLYEILIGHRTAIVVGATGGGKSLIVSTLAQALTDTGSPTALIKISPKALSMSELFGNFGSNNQWVDGLFSVIFKEINKDTESKTMKYIYCDGDIDQHLIENIYSVMDENRGLTLPNCEIVPLSENCGLIFETGNTMHLSPGTISRTGVVYVHPSELVYKLYWEKWIRSRIDEEEMDLLNDYFEKYVPPTLELIFEGTIEENVYHPPLMTAVPQTKLNLVIQLSFMIDAMYPIVEKDVLVSRNEGINEVSKQDLECIFIQAVYASLGSTILNGSVATFDSYIKKISKLPLFSDSNETRAMFGFLPTLKNTLFDYYADNHKKCWIPLEELVGCYIHDKSKPFDEIIVPTKDSCRFLWLMNLVNETNCAGIHFKSVLTQCWALDSGHSYVEPTARMRIWPQAQMLWNHKPWCTRKYPVVNLLSFFSMQYKYKMRAKKKTTRPFLLIGPRGSTKSVMLRNFSQNLKSDEFDNLHITLSTRMSSSNIQEKIRSSLTQYTPFTLKPKLDKKLIVLIDDLHIPQADAYDTQETSEYLKFFMEHSGIFSKACDYKWQSIKDVFCYATMSIKDGCAKHVNERFLSVFLIFCHEKPSDERLGHIFLSILKGHTEPFVKSIKDITDEIIKASLRIFKFAISTLLPVPSKLHYVFNIRDLSRVFEGLTQTSPSFYQNAQQFIRVWRNEVTRVFCDKLVSSDDRNCMLEEIKRAIYEYFPASTNYTLREPLLFGDYRNAMQKGSPRDYEDLLDYEAVYHLFTEIIDVIKQTDPKMNVALFKDILDHLTRIHRVLRMRRGHVLVIGQAGCGKRTILKLASFTAECSVFQILITNKYGLTDFTQDMKKLFKEVCLQKQPTTFLITSHQIINEEFLEIISGTLRTGSFSTIFTEDEKNDIIREDFFSFSQQLEDERFLSWVELDKNCRNNLHIAILTTELKHEQCQKFSSLLDCTTIDWVHVWPSQALSAIAWRHLKDVDSIPDKNKESIVEIVVNIFESTVEFLPQKSNFPSYITPSHYLHFIVLYLQMIKKHNRDYSIESQNLEKAIGSIKGASEQIGKMKEDIESQKLIVQEKKEICNLVENEILEAKETLNMKNKFHSDKSQEIEALNLEISLQMNEIENVLSRALENIEKSQESVRDLNIEDITYLSTLENPTEVSSLIFESVLVLLGKTLINWAEVKKMLCDTQFLSNLEEINLNTITLQQQKQVRARLKRIEKLKEPPETGIADKAFLSLVDALLSYCAAFRETKPKQEKLSDMEKELNLFQNELNGISVGIGAIEAELNKLNGKMLVVEEDLKQTESKLMLTLQKLQASEELITAITDDSERWQTKHTELQKDNSRVIGNSLLCASFLTFCGPFNWEERKLLLQKWIECVRQNRITISKPFHLEPQFVDDTLLSKWRCDHLPKNKWSIQNAILTTFYVKYPLCVDPKEQAVKWIMTKEKKNNLSVLSFRENNFLKSFKTVVNTGNPVLIRDVESLDPLMFNKLESELEGTVNAQHTEGFMQKIKLYMATSEEYPNFDPCIFSLTTVINFSIILEELEETLIDVVLQEKNYDLWGNLETVHRNINLSLYKINNFEKMLLLKVVESESRIIETTGSIEELNKMNLELEEVQKSLEENNVLLGELEGRRNFYRPLAKCGATLFFILSKICCIDVFISNSIDLFIRLFLHSINKNSSSLLADDDIGQSIQQLKKYIFNYTCRGFKSVKDLGATGDHPSLLDSEWTGEMVTAPTGNSRSIFSRFGTPHGLQSSTNCVFSNYQLLVSLQIVIELERNDGNLTDDEIRFFIFGGKEISDLSAPFDWLSKKGWSDLQDLRKQFPEVFIGIINHISTQKDEWEKWHKEKYELLDRFPQATELTPFQKLMLLRCLSPDLLPVCIKKYIFEIMQCDISTSVSLENIEQILEASSPKTPVIIKSYPGLDPLEKISEVARSQGMLGRIDDFAIGSENLSVAEKLLKLAIQTGRWTVVYNCHMNEMFLDSLESLLHSNELHDNFRIWLITEANTTLPKNILFNSVKVAINLPSDFKSKLYQNYEDIDNNLHTTGNHPCFLRLVFVTSFFHSVLQERKIFGRGGWNLEYNFGPQELRLSLEAIKLCLSHNDCNTHDIPWKAMKYLVAEIIYGGYVLDKYDRRVISTYMDEYYDDFLLSVNDVFNFYSAQHSEAKSPLEAKKEDFIAGIDSIITFPISRIVGISEHNEIFYNLNLIEDIWSRLSMLQGYAETKICLEECEADNILKKVLEKMPGKIDVGKIKSMHWEKKYIRPKIFVLLHELELFNALVTKMNDETKNLSQALNGKIEINEYMRALLGDLISNKVPLRWKMYSPETTKSFANWLKHLMLRSEQFNKWGKLGELPAIWLGGMYAPKSYLLAILQVAAKKRGWKLENLYLKMSITNAFRTDETNDQNDNLDCHLSDVFLDGAKWDVEKCILVPLDSEVLLNPLPLLKISPDENIHELLQKKLKVPVYKTSLKNSSLDSQVFEAELDSSVHKSKWILQGVSMILNTD